MKLLHDLINVKTKYILVDIGARGGLSKQWNNLGDYVYAVGFEPDKEEYRKLKKSNRSIRDTKETSPRFQVLPLNNSSRSRKKKMSSS